MVNIARSFVYKSREVLGAVVPFCAFELYFHPANPEFRHPDLALRGKPQSVFTQ